MMYNFPPILLLQTLAWAHGKGLYNFLFDDDDDDLVLPGCSNASKKNASRNDGDLAQCQKPTGDVYLRFLTSSGEPLKNARVITGDFQRPTSKIARYYTTDESGMLLVKDPSVPLSFDFVSADTSDGKAYLGSLRLSSGDLGKTVVVTLSRTA